MKVELDGKTASMWMDYINKMTSKPLSAIAEPGKTVDLSVLKKHINMKQGEVIKAKSSGNLKSVNALLDELDVLQNLYKQMTGVKWAKKKKEDFLSKSDKSWVDLKKPILITPKPDPADFQSYGKAVVPASAESRSYQDLLKLSNGNVKLFARPQGVSVFVCSKCEDMLNVYDDVAVMSALGVAVKITEFVIKHRHEQTSSSGSVVSAVIEEEIPRRFRRKS